MSARQADDLVSVIVPAYNAAATIGETLEFALGQTHRNLEVLLVDDGSTDATAEIAAAFAARDTRVRLLQQPHIGVSAARNLAIGNARGDYLAPLDADDLWHPAKVQAQLAVLRQGGPRLGVVYCWWRRVDMTGLVCEEEWQPYPHEGNLYTALIMGNSLGCGSTSLIRRACIAEVGGYNSKLSQCEDLEFYLRLAESYDFALVPQYLVGYRYTLASASSSPRLMVDSQGLVLAEARRRRPELPARLFRLAGARCEYQRGRACLRRGMWGPGLAMLFNALRQDPIGVTYRIAEPLHRLGLTRSWQLRRMTAQAGHDATTCARELASSAGDLSTDTCGRPPADRVRGRAFLSVSPEPRPGAPLGSTLYGWRCDIVAASLAGRTDRSLCCAAEGTATAARQP